MSAGCANLTRRMPPKQTLHEEIRAMVTNCAVCERDARDAENNLGIDLQLEGIAHPEDSFAYDLLPHRRELHREKLLRKIKEFAGSPE
jgi:hypothetical protein